MNEVIYNGDYWKFNDKVCKSQTAAQAELIIAGESVLQAALAIHTALLCYAIDSGKAIPKLSIWLARKIRKILDAKPPVDKWDELEQIMDASFIADFQAAR